MSIQTSRRTLLKTIPVVTAGAVSSPVLAVEPERGSGKHWAMLIDLRKCVGCQACTVSCHAENNVPVGQRRTHVTVTSVLIKNGRKPSIVQLPQLCNQCDEPVCIAQCPTKATFKLPEGNVVIDSDKCIGCGACVRLCPYGARFINTETKKADKCTFCINRVKAGLLPACVETCVGGARIFGDINDKDSFIAKQLLDAQQSGLEIRVLKPEERTKPNVFYIGWGNNTEQISDTRISY